MSQDEALLIRKLIFAKHSQDATHFCRCVEEIAQTFEQSGERKSACAIRNALHNGYVRSRFELSPSDTTRWLPVCNLRACIHS